MPKQSAWPAGALLAASALLLIGCCYNSPSMFALPIAPSKQERTNWCWVATAQMVFAYFGKPMQQCQIADATIKNVTCCVNTADPACEVTGWPPLEEKDGMGFSSERIKESALCWSKIREQIFCKKKPVVFSWHWLDDTGKPTGKGHVLIATGYDSSNLGDYVKVNDPRQPAPLLLLYSEYVSKPQEYSHWDDFYDITRVN